MKRLSPEEVEAALESGATACLARQRLRDHIAALEAGTAGCAYCPWQAIHTGSRDERIALLREHVKHCPGHPMRALDAEVTDAFYAWVCEVPPAPGS
jgi:hypothetical protein